jgi:hypothetical protein
MKLYTEEEVIKAIKMARAGQNFSFFQRYYDKYEIIKKLKPIKLLSDEEIEDANPFVVVSKHLRTRDIEIWEIGAKWMRSKIQGGNNE